jgi:hypothetical protein
LSGDTPAQARSMMSYLLHALNQPLTGLQCALELAMVAPRGAEEYVRTLPEMLSLAVRMRTLVEAIRELEDTESVGQEMPVVLCLRDLLSETARELEPVADAKSVRLQIHANEDLPLRADRDLVRSLVFRILDSALSLAAEGSELVIRGARGHDAASISFSFSWQQTIQPEHSPYSRPELGLLLAQAGWERLGGSCTLMRNGEMQTFTCLMPVVIGQPIRRLTETIKPESIPSGAVQAGGGNQ